METSANFSRIFGFFFLIALAIMMLFLVVQSCEVSGISSSIGGSTDFEVDNVAGMATQIFEPDLKITNEHDSSKNITISFSERIDGDDTGATDQIWPIIYVSSKDRSNERNFKQSPFKTEIDPDDTTFYIQIWANGSAFADVYTFDIKVTNDDDGEAASPISITVTVPEYNNVEIKFKKNEDEKKIRSGSTATFDVLLTNRGNIFNEKIDVTVDDFEDTNITFVKADIPEPTYINPEFHERDFEKTVTIYMSAVDDTGDGKFEFTVYVDTPKNDEPPGGYQNVVGELEVTKTGGLDDNPPPVSTGGGDEGFPVARFAIPMIIVIAVMGSIGYFFFMRDDEEGGWGDEEEGWGEDGGWGDAEDSYGAPTAAQEFEAPITGPKPRPKSRAAPSGPRSAPAGPKPAGPAHVKCPKCKTGVKVSNPKRPLTIGCPKCSTKFTLKGSPRAAPSGPRPAPAGPKPSGPAHVKCPKCKTGVKVSNPKRPLTIGCPKCSTKFTLKGSPGAGPSSPRPAPAGPKPKPKGAALISCPKCSTKFKVSNPKRPLKVACPKCRTNLNLK